jgi:hypothetical protein
LSIIVNTPVHTGLVDQGCNPSTQEAREEDRAHGNHELHRRPCLKKQRSNQESTNHRLTFQKSFSMWIIFKSRVRINRYKLNSASAFGHIIQLMQQELNVVKWALHLFGLWREWVERLMPPPFPLSTAARVLHNGLPSYCWGVFSPAVVFWNGTGTCSVLVLYGPR